MSSSKDEAINLLSLDGGGVRGVASLVILHEIMMQIKEKLGLKEIPKPCDYFHMIGGTSTGGLIAIMVGRLRMSTEEALREYDECSEKIFSSRNKKWTTATEKFRATALQEVIEDLVRRRNMGDILLDPKCSTYDSKGQCFVCVMPANQVGEPRRLRSFLSSDEKFPPGTKIWEAARATTAASFFFKPMKLKVGFNITEDFIDAAIGCNNPSEYLLLEAADHIGTGRRLGCLVSIGTGTREVRISRASTGLRNITQAPKFIGELIGTLKNTATDGEETHRRLQAKLGVYPNAYFRFNVPGAAAAVRLHEYTKMGPLKDMTTAYLSEPLVATQTRIVAGALARNSSEHGLTLGHIHGIDKEQVVLSTQEAQKLGNPSRFFTGRGDILANIDACFPVRNTGGKPRREFLLYGMGGVGKTQIALKAADDLEDRFNYIFHIDGTDTMTTTQSYANICQEHCASNGTINEQKEAAMRWIETLSEEWLMIYDNYSEKERFEPMLPRRNKGNVIYTSRSQGFLADLPAEFVSEVKPLGEEDAVELLIKASDCEDMRSDPVEMKAARNLVADVGYLPLAIENMGAYIREEKCNATTYFQRFQDRLARPQLMSKPDHDGFLPARPALYTTLDLSYDALVALRRRKGRSVDGWTAENALQALNMLCFYHNEGIPIAMVTRAAEEREKKDGVYYQPLCYLADDPFMDATAMLACKTDSTWNPYFFNRGVRMLQRFSLIKLSQRGHQISMHVMVQAWVQDRMDEQTRRRQALVARIVLIESIKPSWNRLEKAWLRTLPSHVNACMAHPAATLYDDRYQADLDYKLGWFYHEEKHLLGAEEHLLKALHVRKLEYGPHSWYAIETLRMLGSLYHDRGVYGEAEFMYREAVERLMARYSEIEAKFEVFKAGFEERKRKRARHQKLELLLQFGPKQDKDKKEKGEKSMASRTKDDPRDTQFLDRISSELKQWNQQASDIYTELSTVLHDQGKFWAGQVCLKAGIKYMVDAFGNPRHLEVWTREDTLVRRFESGGNLDHWTQRFAATEDFHMPKKQKYTLHEYRFILQIGYARFLLKEEQWEEAYGVYQDTLRFVPDFYGAGDSRTLYLLRKMAWCQVNRGFFEEAEELASDAVERSKASYGQWHIQTAKCLEMFATVLFQHTLCLGTESKVFSLTQEAYDSARLAYSDDHPFAALLNRYLEIYSWTRIDALFLEEEESGEEAKENEFGEHMRRIFAEHGPATKEERKALASAEYREFSRKKLQAKCAERKENFNQGILAKRGPVTSTSGAQGTQGAKAGATGVEHADMPRAEKEWKGKEKEIVACSPVGETL